MRVICRWLIVVGLCWTQAASPNFAQDLFSEGVRTTKPLSPHDQKTSFQVPADLAVDLVAAEPTIQKPLNLAFDVHGRLWVSCTIEYPYPAKEGTGRDRIVILEDTNRDGEFDKQVVFADNLNIPIGILPLGDDCLVFDIPYISRLSDTDGDGRCDRKERLLGPFDCTRDTHGMNNSFIQGFDGWVYACHGFANRSIVAGTDGHQVTLNSGNVYRFRLDGSRIEHLSHGQVNPYGMACDDWFSLFTADCHSKPLTQIVRGAYHPSFGAPHDGLGFAPSMMEHFHGSTAIAGVEVLAAANFPATYAGQIISGNVMTSRINRNRIDWNGAYAQAIEMPDLMATTDPWFRPVNLIQGPDGGVYIADFYNRIIGHYEVPLEHPGRDRDRGRIWRLRSAEISPVALAQSAALASRNFTLEAVTQLLNHPTPRTRLIGLNALVTSVASGRLDHKTAVEWLLKALETHSSDRVRIASLWGVLRLAPSSLSPEMLASLSRHPSPVVRGHLQRILAEAVPQEAWAADAKKKFAEQSLTLPLGRGPELHLTWDEFRNLIAVGLRDEHPRVVQAATDAAGRLGEPSLLDALAQVAADPSHRDQVVVHSAKIALKQMLSGSGVAAEDRAWANDATRRTDIWTWAKSNLNSANVPANQAAVLASVMLAVPQPQAAEFLLDYLALDHGNAQVPEMIQHTARYLPASRANELVQLIQNNFAGNTPAQWALLQAVGEGLARSGQAPPEPILAWSSNLVQATIDQLLAQPEFWLSYRMDRRTAALVKEDAWHVQTRPVQARPVSRDGALSNVPMFSSLPNGETRTGVLRSPRFSLPSSMRFAVAGHRGFPDEAAHELNQVRLHLNDGSIIQVAYPPRNDVAQIIEWDLKPWAGQEGYLEIQDGDSQTAYAWLAVGQFDPPVVAVAEQAVSQVASIIQNLAQTASRYRQVQSLPSLQKLIERPGLGANDRLVLSQTIADLRGQGFGRVLASDLIREDLNDSTKGNVADMIATWEPSYLATPSTENNAGDGTSPDSNLLLLELINRLSGKQQKLLVRAAINDAVVFDKVLEWAEAGRVAVDCFDDPSLRQQIDVANRGNWVARVEHLLKNLPPADAAWRQRATDAGQKLKPWFEKLKAMEVVSGAHLELDSELALATIQQGDLSEWKSMGRQIFKRDCAACHQLQGDGALVGPQLDGINRRGLERVLEDVLLPNQNVDHAFRSQVLLLESGQLIVGLVQSEDETSLQMTDQQGKTVTIPLAEIEERRSTPQSLMPGDVAHQYSDASLLALLSYLMEQTL
jgi:putative heme-binding domain-containing protein